MSTDNLVRIALASPADVLAWSSGEVTRPDTINYRTHRPEKGGLFCERNFGTEKDCECSCGKYRGTRYKGTTCPNCGVLVAHSRGRAASEGGSAKGVPPGLSSGRLTPIPRLLLSE